MSEFVTTLIHALEAVMAVSAVAIIVRLVVR
jgi:hypothetical protein